MSLLIFGVALCGCMRVQDSTSIYRGAFFELVLVRVDEWMPPHFIGTSFRVYCRSSATRSYPAVSGLPAGWRLISNGIAPGAESAEEAHAYFSPSYRVVADRMFVLRVNDHLFVSFDQCGSLVPVPSLETSSPPSQSPPTIFEAESNDPAHLRLVLHDSSGRQATDYVAETADAGLHWELEPTP